MDTLGLARGLQSFPGAGTVPPSGALTQTFRTSDLELKHSPIFGGKTGYFFSKEGFDWLGVEVEAFTSQPTIKNQTVTTVHDLTYIPTNPEAPGICQPGLTCLAQQRLTGKLQVPESSLRLIAFAFNVVARYPGKMFQPYAGVGAGAFYFSGSDAINGRQVVPGLNVLWGLKVLPTADWGLFIEGKYHRATITNFDPIYGLNGGYSAFNVVAGLAYHF
jgi:opacity protein-like surface antigen